MFFGDNQPNDGPACVSRWRAQLLPRQVRAGLLPYQSPETTPFLKQLTEVAGLITCSTLTCACACPPADLPLSYTYTPTPPFHLSFSVLGCRTKFFSNRGGRIPLLLKKFFGGILVLCQDQLVKSIPAQATRQPRSTPTKPACSTFPASSIIPTGWTRNRLYSCQIIRSTTKRTAFSSCWREWTRFLSINPLNFRARTTLPFWKNLPRSASR